MLAPLLPCVVVCLSLFCRFQEFCSSFFSIFPLIFPVSFFSFFPQGFPVIVCTVWALVALEGVKYIEKIFISSNKRIHEFSMEGITTKDVGKVIAKLNEERCDVLKFEVKPSEEYPGKFQEKRIFPEFLGFFWGFGIFVVPFSETHGKKHAQNGF